MYKQAPRLTQMFFGQLARNYAKESKHAIFKGPLLRAAAAIPEQEYELGLPDSPADMQLPEYIEAACEEKPLAASAGAPGVRGDSKQPPVKYNYNYHEYSYYDLKQGAAKLAGWEQNDQNQEQEDPVQLTLSIKKNK